MKALAITLARGDRALYLRIADSIRGAIRSAQLRPGERIPSSRALGTLLRAHRQTVMNALGELVAEGWLVAEPRRGYRVSAALPDSFAQPRKSNTDGRPTRRAMQWTVVRDF